MLCPTEISLRLVLLHLCLGTLNSIFCLWISETIKNPGNAEKTRCYNRNISYHFKTCHVRVHVYILWHYVPLSLGTISVCILLQSEQESETLD